MALSVVLSELQRDTLTRVCDTFIPALLTDEDPTGFWGRAASDLGVPDAIEQMLTERMPEEQLDGLRELLDALSAQGLADASPEQREQIVHGVTDSSPQALAGMTMLKSLTALLFYALPDPATGRNANWEALGYPGPRSAPPQAPKPIHPLVPSDAELTLQADVCVVGSGSGGGVIAGELAAQGRRVVVLEMGGYFNEADFNQLELWAYEHLYLGQGPFATEEGQVAIQAGATLGGGSTVNWMNCLRTPDAIRAEWAREHGLEGLDGADYDRHLDAVWERLGVNDRCSDLNGPHRRLRDACQALGYDFRAITRNSDPERYDPDSAGYLGFGDQSGAKQGTMLTYLQDAARDGAEIVVHCHVERVLVQDGRAAGVVGSYLDGDGRRARVVVRAPQVVVACGSLESPALLQRSGIGGPAAGKYLRLHPAGAVFGVYAEDQESWWGPPQAALSHQFADLDGGHGFLVECPHTTTGITGSAVPWQSGRQHKETMSKFARSASFIFIVRDRGHGEVGVDSAGNAMPRYRLSDEGDQHMFRRALGEMVRMHAAAGAHEIVTLGRKLPTWTRGQDVEAFARLVSDAPLEPYEHAIFSAHQMGSCRMGTDPATSVAGPWGELHDVAGVWIGDASTFPTATGTNPMITVMALARRTAEAMAAAG